MKALSRRQLLQALGAMAGTSTMTSCGYMLYPERREQDLSADSQLDPMIILLDGLLVLVGVLPGIIAFAVDVSSGCIYFPIEEEQVSRRGLRRIRARGRRQQDYELVLREASGLDIKLDDPRLVYVLEDTELSLAQMDRLTTDPGAAIPARRLRFERDSDGAINGFEVMG